MTSFTTVFKMSFTNKRRFVQRLAILQFVAAILIAIWWLISEHQVGTTWRISGLVMFLTLLPVVDIFFLCASSYQNEKLIHTQSWNLIPISTSNLYIANLCSAIAEGIYLIFIQVIMAIVLLIPAATTQDFWKSMQKQLGAIAEEKLWQYIRIQDVIGLAIFIFLVAIFFYCLVSMLNVSSTILSDFVSENYNKIVKLIIEVILLVLAIILLSKLASFLFDTIEAYLQLGMFKHVLGNNMTVDPSIWVTIIITAILDSIMLIINIYLLKNFYEAK
ncbi:hypothetical protein J2Z60_000229 [Lactobacillus colini]|uniref:ABC transporter permease n=1 Tax=Lactobacillus colini TaxID=1819254 RepID=A0ABS4MBL3_9LACO|nr:hypothetical protein [Lactobacillus colini]MBP2057067.1 hypothetical protein [Lactobacillus colini]